MGTNPTPSSNPSNFSQEMPPQRKSTSEEIRRLHFICFRLANDETFPFPAAAKNLSYTSGMVFRHLPTEPRLRCGYVPFHNVNDIALRHILDNLAGLIISKAPKRRNHPHLTFSAESVVALEEITVDIASLLIDERLTGYIIAALKKVFKFRVWRDSSFSSMTYAELYCIISNSPTNLHSSSALMDILYQVAPKTGFDVDVIVEWIRLLSMSPVSSTDPFILNLVDDHDIPALASRIAADEATLNFFETFYSHEKLLPYKTAHNWFRDLWFHIVTINGGSLKDDAFEWLQKHRRIKRKGWIDGIRWGDRTTWCAEILLGNPY